MALSISPQHDVLAYSPHSRFAVLPDLPYRRPSRAGPSASASPPATSPQIMSAPTSPLNRPHYPVMSPLTSIAPIALPPSTPVHQASSRPYPSGGQSSRNGQGIASMPNMTPQQIARQQAAQAAQAGQSYFPPVSHTHSSATSTSTVPTVRHAQAPLSSTNLPSLGRAPTASTDISSSNPAKQKARAALTRVFGFDESGSGSETERGETSGGGGSDSDVTVVDHRRAGKASYSQTDLPALRKRLTSWQSSSSETGPSSQPITQPPSSINTNGKIRDTDTITLPRPPLGRKTPPKTPPTRSTPLQNQSQSFSGFTAAGPSHPLSPGKSPRSKSSTSLASLRRSPATSPRNLYNPLRRSPTSSPRGSSHNLGPLTPVTPNPPTLGARTLSDVGTVSSDADGEDESLTDEMTDSSLSFATRSHSNLRRRSAPPSSSTSGLGLLLGQENGSSETTKTSDDRLPDTIERLYRSSSLLYLRILSIMPACWGTSVLVHALLRGQIRYDVWPWGVDFSREALYRLSQGGGEYEGVWRKAIRGDLILCIAWVSATHEPCLATRRLKSSG